MTTVKENFVVTKLHADNYVACKLNLKLLLIHNHLWDAVECISDVGVKENNPPDVICLSVQHAHIVQIQGFVTGKEAWETFSSLDKSLGVTNEMHPMEDLITSMWHWKEFCMSFICTYKSCPLAEWNRTATPYNLATMFVLLCAMKTVHVR